MQLMGFTLNELAGKQGTIRVLGLESAVLGTFDSWKFTRREKAPPEAPRWTFRGALSYVNEALLALGLPLIIELTFDKKAYQVVFERDKLRLEGRTLTISEAEIRGKD